MPIPIIKRLLGGIQTALGYPDVPKDGFLGGFDIVDQAPRRTNEDGYNQPAPNTDYAYDIGEAELTQKKYQARIVIDVASAYNIVFKISIPGVYTYDLTVVHNAADSTATTYTAIQAAFAGNIYLAGTVFSNATTTSTTIQFDIILDDYLYSDYYLSVVPAVGSATCVPLQDAVSKDKVGALIPISFCNSDGKQQVWSTTGNNEPELSSTSIVVTGGQILLSPIGYQKFEEVYIYGILGTSFQGSYWCLDLISASNYQIIGSTDPGGTLRIPNGSYRIVRYNRTLSCIGQAINTKVQVTGDWIYYEWIRTINLNFRTYKQIQSEGKLTANGQIFDWTDWLNPMKRMYYYGAENTVGGFLSIYNSDAIYNLDTVGEESMLQIGQNLSKVKISVATQDVLTKTILVPGAKPEASYVAFVRFITDDGGSSVWSDPSNVTWTRTESTSVHASGTITGMSLRIDVEQIDYDSYSKIEVGIVQFGTDSFSGYLLPQEQINGQSSISIVDTGLDTTVYALWDASTEVEQIAFFFENVRRIRDFDGYKIAGNVNLAPVYDLTSWAQGIASSVTVVQSTDINIPTDYANNQQSQWNLYGYNSVKNMSTEYTSYMPGDKVRLGLLVKWKENAPPSNFHITDVAILGPVGAEYDVTDSTTTPTALIRYEINVTGINLSTIITADGRSVGDLIEDFRFTRTLINPQVVATGAAIELCNAAAPYQLCNNYFGTASLNLQPFYLAFYSPALQISGNGITFESTDDFIGIQSTLQNSFNVGGTNRFAMDYLGDSATAFVQRSVLAVENLDEGDSGAIGKLSHANIPGTGTVTNRKAVIIQLDGALNYSLADGFQIGYYLKPYPGGVAYPNDPKQERYFVLPQNIWFNRETHTSSTNYRITGGDCFPQKNYFIIALDSDPNPVVKYNTMIGYYAFNRGNFQLRSGLFPSATVSQTLNSSSFDTYTYDECFTPRYPFQNKPAFNPDLRANYQQIASLYYSEKALLQDYAGGNRQWLPLNTKALDIQYGGITGIEVLLGFSDNGMLLVFQDRRFTAQFFDNTANIKSNSGELLIGNGEILGRKGIDYTNYGCSHPWTIIVGKNLAGHDTCYWYCSTYKTFMRIGADGTTNLGLSLAGILNNYMFITDIIVEKTGNALEEINYPDTPARNYGMHAVWNDLSKEYICTVRFIRKCEEYDNLSEYKIDQWVMVSDELWGFEQLPTLYKSLIDANTEPLTDDTAWAKYDYYNYESMLFLTFVWNENTNSWKTFRTYNPKIYGKFQNTYVSSHPTAPNLIFEHNSTLNEALYYCVQEDTGLAATTDPANFKILCTGIGAVITGFSSVLRRKYVVSINGKNYEIVGVNTNDLDMANIDADDILPAATIDSLVYSICNSQDPYIEPVVNGFNPRLFQFNSFQTNSDFPLKRVEHYAGLLGSSQISTQSYNNYSEFRYTGGNAWVPIKKDTTNSPNNNDNSRQYVQGNWMKEKLIWRWGKKNKIHNFVVTAEEQQKTL